MAPPARRPGNIQQIYTWTWDNYVTHSPQTWYRLIGHNNYLSFGPALMYFWCRRDKWTACGQMVSPDGRSLPHGLSGSFRWGLLKQFCENCSAYIHNSCNAEEVIHKSELAKTSLPDSGTTQVTMQYGYNNALKWGVCWGKLLDQWLLFHQDFDTNKNESHEVKDTRSPPQIDVSWFIKSNAQTWLQKYYS